MICRGEATNRRRDDKRDIFSEAGGLQKKLVASGGGLCKFNAHV